MRARAKRDRVKFSARALAVAALTLALPSVASGYQLRSDGRHPGARPALPPPRIESPLRASERTTEPSPLRAPETTASPTPAVQTTHPARRSHRASPLPFRLFEPLRWHRMALVAPPPPV